MSGELSAVGVTDTIVETCRGLRSAEAKARLARDGPNLLPSPRPPPAWRQLAAQMSHFFALMLWAAGGLAFIAGMPQLGLEQAFG